MQGLGIFTQKINQNDHNISNALNQIPITGTIHKDDYIHFIDLYKSAFELDRNLVGTASRLLCMKRPDYFVCISSKNKKGLCRDLNIPQKVTYESYWDEIIERIIDSNWWNSPLPKDPIEQEVWKGRSAFIDSYYYDSKIGTKKHK